MDNPRNNNKKNTQRPNIPTYELAVSSVGEQKPELKEHGHLPRPFVEDKPEDFLDENKKQL